MVQPLLACNVASCNSEIMARNETEPGIRVAALIVAAGRGTRAGNDAGPKQYRQLNGHAILRRAIRPFLDHRQVSDILVVIHRDDRLAYDAAVQGLSGLQAPVTGGETRQQSVHEGLKALAARGHHGPVLIHDAARPFVDGATISRTIAKIGAGQGALAALPVVDTLQQANDTGRLVATVPRDGLYAAQTPQGFVLDEILVAHDAAAASEQAFTDDAALARHHGIDVVIVVGNSENRKLTTAEDVERARMMMQAPDIRTGHGYDTHRLVEGTSIRLCGVDIPHDRRLDGHSDADVAWHALTDALLGCIGEGDIGSHFPPSDPQWRGAASNRFLAHAAELVRQGGGTLTHCDMTLICEEPKIGPHRAAMRQATANVLGIDAARISVKATTNEKIGFVGRGEGIAALATATIVMATP